MLQSELIELALLESSPDENRLKNLAGKDNTLAITAASTDSEIFELILLEIREFEALNSCDDSVEQMMKIPIDTSKPKSLLLRTGPAKALDNLGVINPTRDTAIEEIKISVISSTDMHLRI